MVRTEDGEERAGNIPHTAFSAADLSGHNAPRPCGCVVTSGGGPCRSATAHGIGGQQLRTRYEVPQDLSREIVGCSSLGSLTGYVGGLFVVAKQRHERA
jgi:hypothetical protein